MPEEKNGLAKGLFIGFLIGGVVGAITGLLYAPKSGRELRTDIKKKATDLAEGASDYMKSTKGKAKDIIKQGISRSEQLVSEVKEKAEHIMGDADKVLSDIRERAGSEGNKIKAAYRAGIDTYKNEKGRDTSS